MIKYKTKLAFKIFVVPISNAKNVEEMNFYIDALMLKYCQNTSISFCFNILASAFESTNQINAKNTTSKLIEQPLTSQFIFTKCIDITKFFFGKQKIILR